MVYNVIVTAYRREGRFLLKELSKYGEFKTTSFRDVLVGEVEDVNKLLKVLCDEPPLSLARAIPIKEVIEFTKPEELFKLLKKKVIKHAKLKPKETFRVTIERRGWKGEINSHEWAKKLGALIYEKTKNPVSLTKPDVEIVIEVMQDTCGITVIKKKDRDKYFFIRTK